MTDGLPSDAKLQACIQSQVNKADDITLLTRTIIKDGLAKKFKLSPDQRELLNTDAHYKVSIKAWIQDAIDNKPDVEENNAGPSSEAKKPPKKSPPKKAKKSESKDEDKGNISEFSSLEDDDEPKKKKPRKSKGSPPTGDGAAKSSSAKAPAADSLEMKLKKLKALVLLCGTRKSWKKLFEEGGCPDDENASEGKKTKARKGQIAVVSQTLLDIGMTQPFTKAKAAEIQKQKEVKQELEAIQVANKTEKSTTRGGKKIRTSSSKTASPESDTRKEVTPAPSIRNFNRSLADFAAELNDD